jgi:tellurite resistance protein
MFKLQRSATAKTQTDSGMATNRCPNCHAPLTDTLSASCDYCGTMLGTGQGDWVLARAQPYESWDAVETERYQAVTQPKEAAAPAVATREGVIADVKERERLLYMMAAMAAADGTVDAGEKKLLRVCAQRWSVPWSNVELAISSGEQLFEKLVPKNSPEAERFLSAIVQVALADGKIDRKERRMLESAAERLGIPDRLTALLGGR